MNNPMNDVEGMTFPCRIDVKIFLRNVQDQSLDQYVKGLALEFFEPADVIEIKSKLSTQAQYRSVTCSLNVTDRPQIDAFYLKLDEEKQIIMVI